VLSWLSSVLILSCGGSSASLGLDLPVRVRDAQLVRAALPAPSGGPAVTLVDVRSTRVEPGEGNRSLSGRAQLGGSLRVSAEGMDAHWVVPLGVLDPAVPGDQDWSVRLDFGRSLPESLRMLFQAVGLDGAGGSVSSVSFDVVPVVPAGELVFALEWDQPADVDLWVRVPSGGWIGPKDLNSFSPPRPGAPPVSPDAFREGGKIDFDAHANCVIDGRARENAVWTVAPPAGEYRVQVALAAQCGVARVAFRVRAFLRGELMGEARGVLHAVDAERGREDLAGVRALVIEVP
jgi:hypothetical protein